jgi:hypothetical protein
MEDGSGRITSRPLTSSTEQEDASIRQASTGFVAWVSGFINRVIGLLENLPEEKEADQGSRGGSSTEGKLVALVE